MQQLLRLDYFCFMWSFTKGTSYERCPCLRTWCSSKSRMTVMLVDTDRKRWSKVISMLRRTAWMQTQRQGMISNWHVPAPDNNKIMKYYSCLQDRETHTHTLFHTQTSLPCARLGGLLESLHPKRWAWHRLVQGVAPFEQVHWPRIAQALVQYNQVYSSDKKGDRISKKNTSRGKDPSTI